MLVLPTAHGSVGEFHYRTHALIPNSTQVKGYRPMRSALGNASFFPSSNSSQKNPLWQGKTSCEMRTFHTDSLPGKKASFSVFMPRQDAVRTQRNFRPSALKSVRSMSLKSSCHFWVKQAQDIPQREADVIISQKMRPII